MGGLNLFPAMLKTRVMGINRSMGYYCFLRVMKHGVALHCVAWVFAWVVKGSNRSFCYSFASVRSNVDEVLVRVSLA
jgi:hypothetical protein